LPYQYKFINIQQSTKTTF